ncbi:hypothetical protein FACS1894204_06110 [Synergistales bacterium]|nr:hypothetical protein FACS1894204_06110 [Synergistales bacterium]
MAVHYTGGGGGLLGTVLKGAGLIANLIPGGQVISPWLMGGGALANGDVGGAISAAAGGAMNNTPAPQVNSSFNDAMQGAVRSQIDTPFFDAAQQKQNPMLAAATGKPTNGLPKYNSDPATGINGMPTYQSGDMTDSIAREQGGYLPDYWKYFGQRRKV